VIHASTRITPEGLLQAAFLAFGLGRLKDATCRITTSGIFGSDRLVLSSQTDKPHIFAETVFRGDSRKPNSGIGGAAGNEIRLFRQSALMHRALSSPRHAAPVP